jgi:hypothetical protein
MSGSDGHERSSTSQHLLQSATDLLKSELYKKLTFKDLSFDQYRVLLFITLMVNLVFLSLQVSRFGYLLYHKSLGNDNGLTLVIIAFILTSINIIHLIKLMIAPTARLAVSCMGIILIQEAIFIAETVVYYQYATEDYIIALSVVFLFLQLISVVVVYRFWELILFNFDSETWAGGTPSMGNLSDVNLDGIGRKSTGGIHPAKVNRSPVHIENNA